LGICNPNTATCTYTQQADGSLCETDSEAAGYCVSGICLPKHTDGQSCSASHECQGNNCVGGICCLGNCTCALPWGGNIAHGQSVTTYEASNVACGQSCNAQTRTCTNGVLSGSYAAQNCSAQTCSCSLPWGGALAATQSVLAYESSSVGCGQSCVSQTRTCNNGVLSGSYQAQSCSPQGCTCSAPWGGTLNAGQSVTAYQATSVACNQSCVQETRTCGSNGVLSGSYTNPNCGLVCTGCISQTLSWSQSQTAWKGNSRTAASYQCSATVTAGAHGASRTLTASGTTRTGSAAAQCNDGTWQLTGVLCDGVVYTAPLALSCSSTVLQESKWISWYAADYKRCADTEGLIYWVSRDNDTAGFAPCTDYPTVGSSARDACMRGILRQNGQTEYDYAQANNHVSILVETNSCGSNGAYGWVTWNNQCKYLP